MRLKKQAGEIATTLTLIAVGIMAAGAMLGSLFVNKETRTSTKAANAPSVKIIVGCDKVTGYITNLEPSHSTFGFAPIINVVDSTTGNKIARFRVPEAAGSTVAPQQTVNFSHDLDTPLTGQRLWGQKWVDWEIPSSWGTNWGKSSWGYIDCAAPTSAPTVAPTATLMPTATVEPSNTPIPTNTPSPSPAGGPMDINCVVLAKSPSIKTGESVDIRSGGSARINGNDIAAIKSCALTLFEGDGQGEELKKEDYGSNLKAVCGPFILSKSFDTVGQKKLKTDISYYEKNSAGGTDLKTKSCETTLNVTANEPTNWQIAANFIINNQTGENVWFWPNTARIDYVVQKSTSGETVINGSRTWAEGNEEYISHGISQNIFNIIFPNLEPNKEYRIKSTLTYSFFDRSKTYTKNNDPVNGEEWVYFTQEDADDGVEQTFTLQAQAPTTGPSATTQPSPTSTTRPTPTATVRPSPSPTASPTLKPDDFTFNLSCNPPGDPSGVPVHWVANGNGKYAGIGTYLVISTNNNVEVYRSEDYWGGIASGGSRFQGQHSAKVINDNRVVLIEKTASISCVTPTPACLDITPANIRVVFEDTSSCDNNPNPHMLSTNEAGINGGDINGDGVVNSVDFVLLQKSIGTKEGKKDYNENGDLNKDGVINALDGSLMLKVTGTGLLNK